MIITISGKPGAGKTTIGKLLAQKLGYKFYSMGDLRGEMAAKMGLTIDQLNEIGKKEDWTDKKADDYQKELGEKSNNLVFDGWISFHFIPHSFKVFLEVDSQIAAERVFKDQRPDEEHQNSPEAVKELLAKRMENSRQRYIKYYSIDFLDKSHYDFIIDTTNLTPNEVINKILEKTQNYESRRK